MRFKVATLNVWALPFGIAGDLRERVEAIAQRVSGLDSDVIAFQEVWISEARKRLVAAGSGAGYPEVWYHPDNTGGLLILSRHPIREARFHSYLLRGLPQRIDQGEYYAGKGFLHLRVAVEEGVVSVLNTHLHAQYGADTDSDYIGLQTGQIVQFAAYLRGLSEPVLAPGDYNVHEASVPYRVLLGLGGLEDCAVALDKRQATARKGNPYREGRTGADSRIDYVFYRGGGTRGVQPVSIERIFDDPLHIDGQPAAYSDHDGLLAEFQLTQSSEPRFREPEPEIFESARKLLKQGRADAEQRQMHKRVAAGACLVAGSLPLDRRLRSRLNRRRFLHRMWPALAAMAFASSAGMLTLSEVIVPDELAAYDLLLDLLESTWSAA